MFNKGFIKKIRKDFFQQESERRQIISVSNDILHQAKKIIFSLHRLDFDYSEQKFLELEKELKKLEKNFGFLRINKEGSYKAAVEEYIEAKFFYFILKDLKINKIKGLRFQFDSYLAGICDLTGELVRFAINQVSLGNIKEVERVKIFINDILKELSEFSFTGYLRTKYDQSRNNLRKIEQINYEVKLKYN